MFARARPRRTLFPTARQTFGDEMTWTLENLPKARISFAARRRTPLPKTTEYSRADERTGISFFFAGILFSM
jgi:hypothetical protein